jgi:hypothetical protein
MTRTQTAFVYNYVFCYLQMNQICLKMILDEEGAEHEATYERVMYFMSAKIRLLAERRKSQLLAVE